MLTSLRVDVDCEDCLSRIPAGDLCYRVTAVVHNQVDRIWICRDCVVKANEGLKEAYGSSRKKS